MKKENYQLFTHLFISLIVIAHIFCLATPHLLVIDAIFHLRGGIERSANIGGVLVAPESDLVGGAGREGRGCCAVLGQSEITKLYVLTLECEEYIGWLCEGRKERGGREISSSC